MSSTFLFSPDILGHVEPASDTTWTAYRELSQSKNSPVCLKSFPFSFNLSTGVDISAIIWNLYIYSSTPMHSPHLAQQVILENPFNPFRGILTFRWNEPAEGNDSMQWRLETPTSVFSLSKADLPAASHMRLVSLLDSKSVESKKENKCASWKVERFVK